MDAIDSKGGLVLAQLKAIDQNLRQGIQDLATLMSQSAPDEEALSRTRLKLTRLTGRRRALIQCTILPHLRDLPPAGAAQLANLRLDAAAASVKFSSHITRWTTRAIRTDWAGYQAVSAEMRRSIVKQIEREAALLYPLLEAKPGVALELTPLVAEGN